MFTVNKHYDIIFCHNNGRRCYKRFSHEAAVGYHCGQWERPRYAVNWFAKAFLKKPSAERAGPATTAAVRAARLVGWCGGGVSFWAYTTKITSRQGLYLCYIITPRATGRSDRDGGKSGWLRRGTTAGASRGRWREKKSGWPRKFFGGWSARPSNVIRLMNRNNSRAIVLFGSFQLTAAPAAPNRAGLGQAEPSRAKPPRNKRRMALRAALL